MLRPHRMLVACLLALSLAAAAPSHSASGLSPYAITKENGPWMVLVKSFRGPGAVDMAEKLIEELRQEHHIKAYLFVQPAGKSPGVQMASLDTGRVRRYDEAAVLAGDFQSESEKDATKLRDKIRGIRPKCIPPESTSRFRSQRGVLTTAFLVTNPLQPPPPKEKKPDPLLLKLNTGKHSLYNCPGECTLNVLEFHGAVAFTQEQEKELAKHSQLQQAGEDAERVTQLLLREGIDAYVFHGLYGSLVTVGSFSSPQDPQIELIRKQLLNRKVGSFNLSSNPMVIPVPRRSASSR